MQKKYVDDFFQDGSLRISSFQEFAKHPNEKRRDAQEGLGLRQGFSDNNSGSILYVGRSGIDCYVLCGTLSLTKKVIDNFDDCDCGFVIDDVMEFSAEISRAIPYFNGGLEGGVIYQDDTSIARSLGKETPQEIMEKNRTSENSISFNAINELMAKTGGAEEVFIKHSDFSEENEYRMIWKSSQPINNFLDIKIPEARKFCRRFDIDK